MGTRTGIGFLSVALAALAAGACARSFAELERRLDRAEWAGAAKWASGDPEREDALAAGVLERAAASGEDAAGAVRLLASAGDRGRPALERLRGGGARPASALAAVALSRRRPPSGAALDALLSDPSGEVRSYAVATWADDLPTARLARLLLDLDPDVRRGAVSGIGRFGRGAFSRELRDTARLDPDARVRAEALRHGRALGDGALDLLRAGLRSGEPGEAQAAVLGLGDLGSRDALSLLEEEALGLPDGTAIVAAAELARVGSAAGKDRLIGALSDPDERTRAAGAVNVARAGLADGDARLIALLDDEAPRVALAAAHALAGEEHAGRVAAALRRLMEAGGAAGEEARDALASRGDAGAAEETSLALDGAGDADAIRILGRLRATAPLRSRLVALLGDPRAAVRRAAAEALLR